MCSINPKHQMHFTIGAYTSNPDITQEEFQKQVIEKLFQAELELNKDMRFRFIVNGPTR